MKDRVPDTLVEAVERVRKIPYAKKVLKPLYVRYCKRVLEKRKKHFHKDGLNALKQFDNCFQSEHIDYFLIFGSLLGAIREKGFIEHDCDIDVAVFIEDRNEFLDKSLKKYGFKRIHSYKIEDGKLGCEETYRFKKTSVSIDIFYVYPPIDTYPYVCCWNMFSDCVTPRECMKKHGGLIPRRIELPIDHNIIRVPFETIEVNIPKNAHQISEFSYGEDYMIPNPNAKAPTDHRTIWYDKLATYTEY